MGWFNHQLYSFISGKSIRLVKYDKLARMMIVQPEGFGSSNWMDPKTWDRSIGSDGFLDFLHLKRIPLGAGPPHLFPCYFVMIGKFGGYLEFEPWKNVWEGDECWWWKHPENEQRTAPLAGSFGRGISYSMGAMWNVGDTHQWKNNPLI